MTIQKKWIIRNAAKRDAILSLVKTYAQYGKYKKPSWAPPASWFGPVWTVLYILIAISFGYVLYLYSQQQIPGLVALPFALNLVFNLAFTPIQFRLRSFKLAALDVLLVLVTLEWAMCMISPYVMWVVYMDLPYLAWVFFATVLQLTITRLNWKKK